MGKTNQKHKYGAKYDFSVGSVGDGYIKLPEGKLHLSTIDIAIDGTKLSLPISRSYVACSEASHVEGLPKGMLGADWKLNIEQYLVHSCQTDSEKSDNCTYHLIDSENIKHEFITKYYYEYNNIKTYITDKTAIDIAVDGSMTIIAGNICHAVNEETKSCSNKILHVTKHDLKGVTDYEQRADEIVQIEEQIKSYGKRVRQLKTAASMNNKMINHLTGIEVDDYMGMSDLFKTKVTVEDYYKNYRTMQANQNAMEEANLTFLEEIKTNKGIILNFSVSSNNVQKDINSKATYNNRLMQTLQDKQDMANQSFSSRTSLLNACNNSQQGVINATPSANREMELKPACANLANLQLSASKAQLYLSRADVQSSHTQRDINNLLSTTSENQLYMAINQETIAANSVKQNSETSEIESADYSKTYASTTGDLALRKANLALSKDNQEFDKTKKELELVLQEERLRSDGQCIIDEFNDINIEISKLNKQLEQLKNTYPTEIIADGGIMYGFAKKWWYTTEEQPIKIIGEDEQSINVKPLCYTWKDSDYYRLVLIFDSKENQIAIDYIVDKVNEIVDNNDSKLEFTYSGARLAKITAASGESVKYGYSAMLNAVEYSNCAKIAYSYESSKLTKVETFNNGIENDVMLTSYQESSVQVKEIIVRKFAMVIPMSNFVSVETDGVSTENASDNIITETDRLSDNYMAFDYNGTYVRMFNHVANSITTFDDATHRVISEHEYFSRDIDSVRSNYSSYQEKTVDGKYNGETIQRIMPVVCAKKLGIDPMGLDYVSDNGDDGELLGDACCMESFNSLNQKLISDISKQDIINEYSEKCKQMVVEVVIDKLDDSFTIEDVVLNISYHNSKLVVPEQKVYNITMPLTNEYSAIAIPFEVFKESQENEKILLEWDSIKLDISSIDTKTNVILNSMSLRACDIITEQYNKDDLLTSKIDSRTGCEVSYYYDTNDRLSKQVTEWNGEKYITYCEYNEQGKMTKKYIANGIVEEQAVSRDGKTVEELTYSDKSPAIAFISRTTYDDEGRVDKTYTPTGEHYSQSKYTAGSNYESAVVAPNGNIASSGTDKHGYNVQISADNDGEHIDNKFVYDCGMLVSTEHNGFSYNYEYDEYGRTTKIYLDDIESPYVSYAYGLDMLDVKLASGEVYSTEYRRGLPIKDCYTPVLFDINGERIEVEPQLIAEYYYNAQEMMTNKTTYAVNVVECKIVVGEPKCTTIDYDMYGRVVSTKVDKVTTTSNYAIDDELLSNTICFGEKTTTISMARTKDSDRLLSELVITQKEFSDLPRADGEPPIILFDAVQSISYDDLKRINSLDIASGNSLHTKQYSYLTVGKHTTNYIHEELHSVSEITAGTFFDEDSTKYTYDALGNITQVINNNIPVIRYTYDKMNRLIREDNRVLKTDLHPNGKTTVFIYNKGGNITDKYITAYSLDEIDLLSAKHIPYSYRRSGWKDQLLSYDGGGKFVYDDLGNPEVYNGKIATWSHGRQLDNFDDITFGYNADGIRNSKIHNSDTTNYILSGTKVLAESRGNNLIEYHYGADGIIGMTYEGSIFVFRKNISGDITSIFDKNGQECARYTYDAWGNHRVLVEINGEYIDISNNIDYTNNIGNINPFRYRGYYFDVESSLYYLNTRYYDPAIGRFINADEITILDETRSQIHGLNLYMYCGNNPVMNVDPSGRSFLAIFLGMLFAALLSAAVSAVSQGVQYGWDNINVGQVVIDGLFAGASVFLAATGISAIASVAIGGALGFAQYAIGSTLHGEEISLGGSLISVGLGMIGGAVSGAGAKNTKMIARKMTGRASQGMKALITTAGKYGSDSRQLISVSNLYKGSINSAMKSISSKALNRSIGIIGGAGILVPGLSYLSNLVLSLLMTK